MIADDANAALPDSSWTLDYLNNALTLSRADGTRLSIDFTAGKVRHRQQEAGRWQQPLARAVAPKRLRQRLARLPRVLDATAGLGQDAWFLASLGCEMVLFERHPVVHALLADALVRAHDHPDTAAIAERMCLYGTDVLDGPGLPGRVQQAHIDTVYLDPMYPPMRRRGASAKGMQFLHALLDAGESTPADTPDLRASALLHSALQSDAGRVVLKRPKAAPPATPAPSGWQGEQLSEGSTRFDLYLRR